MLRNDEPNEILEIVKGFLLLMLCHILAVITIFILGLVISSFVEGYSFLVVWFFGALGFLFWQLIYVIPLVYHFRHQGKIGMMKGLIIGAVLTALLNGTLLNGASVCFLILLR